MRFSPKFLVRATLGVALLLASPSGILAAVSSAVQWDVRTTGSDTNGGGFHVGSSGSDYSQQNSAQIAVADAVTNGTTTITSATANFGSTHVGNVCFVSGGTGSIAASWYEVISVTNATTIVVDRSAGLTSGTGVTLNLGGSLASPGGMAGALATSNVGTSGQIVNIKAGTYTVANGTNNTSGNKVNSSLGGILWWGYNASHGDGGTKPVLQAGAGSMTIFTQAGNDVVLDNIEFQAGGQTSVTALSVTGARDGIRNCKASTATCFIGTGANALFYNDEASGASAGSGAYALTGGGTKYAGCTAHGGSVTGLSLATGDIATHFISYANTATGITFAASGGAVAIRSLAYGNTGANVHGFDLAGQANGTCLGCAAISNGTSGSAYGFNTSAPNASNQAALIDCAAYGNFTANTNGTFRINTGFQSLSGDPTVAGGSQNFALNNTTGSGKSLRAAGWPSSWPGASTTGYPDIGPVQSQSTSGPNNIGYIMSPIPDRPAVSNTGIVVAGLILVVTLAGFLASKLLLRKPRA